MIPTKTPIFAGDITVNVGLVFRAMRAGLPGGMIWTWYFIYHYAQRDEAVPLGRLCKAMGKRPSNIYQHLGPLKKLGLLTVLDAEPGSHGRKYAVPSLKDAERIFLDIAAGNLSLRQIDCAKQRRR